MNRKLKWIYNPFEQMAGWKAFGIGLIILCITTVTGYYSHTVFYGISIQPVPTVTWGKVFFLQGSGLAVTVLVMWIIALLSAKHVRFQDVLGTVTLAKYPLIVAAIVFLMFNHRLMEITEKVMSMDIYKIINEITLSDYTLLFVFSIMLIPVLIWEIVLLFNAFKVSTNLKGVKCALLFTAILLISEIIINVLKGAVSLNNCYHSKGFL